MPNQNTPQFRTPKVSTDYSDSQTGAILKRLGELEDRLKNLEAQNDSVAERNIEIAKQLNELKTTGATDAGSSASTKRPTIK